MSSVNRRIWLSSALALMVLIVVRGGALAEQVESGKAVRSVGIVLDGDASAVERRAAEALKSRIVGFTPIAVDVGTTRRAGADLYIHLGQARPKGVLHDLCVNYGVRPPGKGVANPEGFAVKTVGDGKDWVVVAVGADERGVLYAV